VQRAAAGENERLRAEHNSRVTAAFYGAIVPHQKQPLRLKDLLIPKRKARGAKQDWREIKAAFQVALPRETPKPKRSKRDGKEQRDRRPARRPRAQ
jgi:hypothetical protein